MVGKRGGGSGGKKSGKRANVEVPWYHKRAQAQESWRAQLRRRGVQFAIGSGPCKARSKSQCIGEWTKLDACRAPSNETGAAYNDWASWKVPDALSDRGVDVGDPALYGPLLRKLERGEPITILALGSSVVGHRLFNLGEPGGDLMPSLLACPKSYLSFDPDVVLLDFFTAYHGGRDAAIYERVVRLLLTQRRTAAASAVGSAAAAGGSVSSDATAPPVVMFVNFFEFADRHHASSTYTTMGSQLVAALRELRKAPRPVAWSPADVSEGTAEDVATLWHSVRPSGVSEAAALIRQWAHSGSRHLESTDVYRNWWRDAEVRALQMAYRLPSVWMFRAFGPEFESHAHGLWVRDFACYDGLHPNHDGRAEAMVSDLIWTALWRGLDAARALATPRRRDAPHDGSSGGAGGFALRALSAAAMTGVANRAHTAGTRAYVLSPPLQTLPPRVGHVCFTFDAEGWEMLTGAKRSNRKLHEQSLIQTLQAPTILANRGWAFIMYEPSSRTPFKPGIVATTPGSVLHFEVDTSRALSPSVSFQYLESRTGMGVARLECTGCACEPTDIDATGEVARLSTLVTREVVVTPHAHCGLKLLLLNRTKDRGGGHKFKLSRLFVTGAVADPTGTAAPLAALKAVSGDSSVKGADGALDGALPLRSMRPRFCRGPRCTSKSGPGARSGGGQAAPTGGFSVANIGSQRIAQAVHAKRNEALEMLRAARRERPFGIREAALRLLLPLSHAPADSGDATALASRAMA